MLKEDEKTAHVCITDVYFEVEVDRDPSVPGRKRMRALRTRVPRPLSSVNLETPPFSGGHKILSERGIVMRDEAREVRRQELSSGYTSSSTCQDQIPHVCRLRESKRVSNKASLVHQAS